MIAALLALLLASQDPRIEEVERLAGPVRRPYLWCPLAVTLSSQKGYEGDLVARSSFGVSFALPVRVEPGGRVRSILPSLDPLEVLAGGTSARVPPDGAGADWLVAVDDRLPFAAELQSSERVRYQVIRGEALSDLRPRGLLEAFDLVLVHSPDGLPLAAFGISENWARPSTREEAEARVAALRRPPARIEAVEPRLWTLAPRGGWVPAKKTFTLLFATLYFFGTFAALVSIARRFPRFALGVVGGLALLGIGAYLVLFPRGQLWVAEHSCQVVSTEGIAAEGRLWFAGAAAPLRTDIAFPRLVKPVFPQPRGADEPYVIRLEGKGCTVKGLALPGGGAACFAAVADCAPAAVPGSTLPVALHRAGLVRDDRHRPLGELAAGSPFPPREAEEGPPPRDADFVALHARFVTGNGVFGWLDLADRPAYDVRSPDLADAREASRFIVFQLPKGPR